MMFQQEEHSDCSVAMRPEVKQVLTKTVKNLQGFSIKLLDNEAGNLWILNFAPEPVRGQVHQARTNLALTPVTCGYGGQPSRSILFTTSREIRITAAQTVIYPICCDFINFV
jgi:hypothetical protein